MTVNGREFRWAPVVFSLDQVRQQLCQFVTKNQRIDKYDNFHIFQKKSNIGRLRVKHCAVNVFHR